MIRPRLLHNLVDPFPGRVRRTADICIACMLVVLVSMTYQIPEPALSTYLIFFVAKENSGSSLLASIVFVFVITFVVALLVLLAPISLNYPTLRILVIAAMSFAAFFLEAASKIGALGSVIGLVVGYVLDLLQNSFVGEITTRGLLYAWLFVTVPMGIFASYTLIFGRHPEILLRENLAARVRCASAALGQPHEKKGGLAEIIAGGNAGFHAELAMVKLFWREPVEVTKGLGAFISLTYALAIALDAFRKDPADVALAESLRARLDRLALAIDRFPPAVINHESASTTAETVCIDGLPRQIANIVASLESVAAQSHQILAGHAPPKEKKESGFFHKDAFKNPDYVRFSTKATLAVVICYITFNLLDWPGIHTSLITCFIVALPSVGETVQKMSLRIAGCMIGAAMGLIAIVYVLPETTSITDLMLVVGVATLPAAWVSVGKPNVSYIGFQIAIALYLCVLQGTEPKFDLTIARDRTIGVLFGNIVVFMIFTNVLPVSMRTKLRRELANVLEQCSTTLASYLKNRPIIELSDQSADLQTLVGHLEEEIDAYNFELLQAPNGRQRKVANWLTLRALRDVVHSVAATVAYPRPQAGSASLEDFDRLELILESQVRALGGTLTEDVAQGAGLDRGESATLETYALIRRIAQEEPAWVGRLNACRSLQIRIDRLRIVLSEHRRLLRRAEPMAV
jgi:multidrug resistance protein MdtO